jgi:hypothetical protein
VEDLAAGAGCAGFYGVRDGSSARCRRVPFARATATSPDQPKSPALSSGAHRAQYVIPYGIGGNPFWCRRLRTAMQLFDQIAARVFGPGRLDASPANAHHATMPVGVRTRSSAPEAATSGLASGRRRQHQRNRFFIAFMPVRHCALRDTRHV